MKELELNKIHNIDCLEFMKGMAEKSVDCVITDPPYNISRKSGGLRKLDFGEWDKDDSDKLVFDSIIEIERICKGTAVIFCGNQQFSYIYNFFESKDWIVKCLVWLKPNPNVINSQHSYVTGQELLVYAKRRNALYNPTFELSYFNYPFPSERSHPTEKPIQLVAKLIKNSSKENDLIFDPFLGSGTTAVACKMLKRNYIACEIDKNYYETAIERIKSISNPLF